MLCVVLPLVRAPSRLVVRGARVARRAVVTCLTVATASCAPPPPAVTDAGVEPVAGFVVSRPFDDVRNLVDVAVLGAGPGGITSAWAVGTDGTVLHFDGATWTRDNAGTTVDLHGVSGVVDDQGVEHVMVVGDLGTVLVRVGGVWSNAGQATTARLTSGYLRAIDDGFVVGDDGTFLRFDGAIVRLMSEEAQVEREVLDVDGTTSTQLFPIADDLQGVDGVDDQVFAVASRGIVYRFNADGGERWRLEDSGTSRTLADVFAGEGVWAPTSDGVLLRRGDDGWTDDVRVPSPVFLQGTWVRGGEIYAVGLSEDLFRFDGSAWSLTTIEEAAAMRAVDGADLPVADDGTGGGREVIAVGGGGRIVRGPAAFARAGETLLATRLPNEGS